MPPCVCLTRKCWPQVRLSAANLSQSRYFKCDSGWRAEYRDSEGNHVQASAGEALLSLPSRVSATANTISAKTNRYTNAALAGRLPAARESADSKLALNMGKQQLIASPEGAMGSCNYASKCGCTISCSTKAKVQFPVAWATRVFAIDSREISCLTHHEEKAALTCGDGAFIRERLTLRWLPIPHCALC